MMDHLLRQRYELLEQVGEGGEGRVMRTLDHQHDRVVALKIRHVTTAEQREDLLTEARILLAVPPHPNLPLVREDFFDEDRYIIAMDWVEGSDLATLLRSSGRPGLPIASVLRWLADAAAALTHLHSQDPPVIHGDVKPANLILTAGGRVVLVDFGLSSSPGTRLRRGGTRGFAAPELAAGAPPARAADVYALAATAWALLTGSPPTGIRSEWAGFEPDEAERLEAAIRTGLATDPARRPATPGELVEQIRAGHQSALPTGVLTFCLTDIEGSTARWEAHPAAMARALVRHDDLVADAVEAAGGHLLKSMGEGDATVSVFANAAGAASAAVEIQRRLGTERWDEVGGLRTRIALHTGEAERRGGDYFGAALSVAARLRSLAAGGEVFVSGTTARLLAPALPEPWRLVELGPHRLAGIEHPVDVYALAAPGVDAPPPVTECPYPGLRPFDESSRDRFFGRESVVDEIVAKVRSQRLTVLVGSSGSGKSSVLRAGVAPAFVPATVVTGSELGLDDLQRPGLLVVDQFEELFTVVDGATRSMLIDTLLERTEPVVIGIRADFYGRCGEHPALASAVAASHVLLGSMDDEDLRRAITGPAEAAGLRLEPGLLDLLVHEVAGEPGALPLLSHALRATWERRDGRTLTLAAYHEAGGVRAAIAHTADGVVAGLEAGDQRVVRSIFLRLIEPGEGVEDTGRRAQLDEVLPASAGRPRVDELLRTLADARLISIGEGTIEVAHEALIREWPQLRMWLDEDREGIRVHRHLTRAASAWHELGRDRSELYRGTRLALALEWAGSAGDLSPLETDFLDASRADAERARRADERANRRLRVSLASVAALLVLAVAAASVAFVQRGRAADERDDAEAARVATQALATVDKRADLGLLLAAAAYRMRPTDDTASGLLGAVTAHPLLAGVLTGVEGGVLGAASTPDGRRVITAAASEGAVVWDVASRRPVARLVQDGFAAVAVAVTPDGRQAVIGTGAEGPGGRPIGQLQVWDLDTFELDLAVESPASDLTTAAFIDGGRRLVTQSRGSSSDGRAGVVAVVWDTATWRPVATWHLADQYPEFDAVTVSGDGELLAVPVGEGKVQVFRTADRTPLGGPIDADAILGARAGRIVVLAFDPDASVLAFTTEADGRVVLVDPASGAPIVTPLSLEGDVGTAIGFRPDGRVLAVSRSSGPTQLFDVATGQPLGAPFGVGADHVRDLTWSPDGSRLATFHADFLGALWAMDGARSIGTPLGGPDAPVTDLAFGGGALFTASLDGTVARRDVRTGAIRERGRSPRPARALSVDGEHVIAGDEGGNVTVWSQSDLGQPIATVAFQGSIADVESRRGSREVAVAVDQTSGGASLHPSSAVSLDKELDLPARVAFVDVRAGSVIGAPIEIDDAVPLDVAYSPDGARLAVATRGFNGLVQLYDAETRQPLWDTPLQLEVTSLAFSHDGADLFVGTARGIVRRYSVATGEEIEPALEGDSGVIEGVTVSADGRWLVTTTALDRARIWDLRENAPFGRELIGGDRLITSAEALSASHPFAARSALSPDGTRLAVGGAAGAVMWDLRPDVWLDAACALAGRDLTAAERDRYLRRAVDPCPGP